MFTNNKDFYPTPQNIIDKMLCDVDFTMVKSILEPSAGKGNIVEALKKKEESHNKYWGNKEYQFDIDCIEVDQNLQHILKGKNFRVVHNDFLTYNTMKEYNLT